MARPIVPVPRLLLSSLVVAVIWVWTVIALAAFVPSIFLDWKSIAARQAPAKAPSR